jgi:hypothetical protein
MAGSNGGQKAKAEVNLIRLAGAFNALVAGEGDGEGRGAAGAEAEPEWRKLEAYARRMRELLNEVRRSQSTPPPERLAEYERMLSAAAAAADAARRKQDDLPGGVTQVLAPAARLCGLAYVLRRAPPCPAGTEGNVHDRTPHTPSPAFACAAGARGSELTVSGGLGRQPRLTEQRRERPRRPRWRARRDCTPQWRRRYRRASRIAGRSC